jgi:hypothetical protein
MPRKRMTPGERVRIALALADADITIATLTY